MSRTARRQRLNRRPGAQPRAASAYRYSTAFENDDSCRMIETINNGKPSTSFMHFGDRIRIEMNDANGTSIFGTIDQVVEQYDG